MGANTYRGRGNRQPSRPGAIQTRVARREGNQRRQEILVQYTMDDDVATLQVECAAADRYEGDQQNLPIVSAPNHTGVYCPFPRDWQSPADGVFTCRQRGPVGMASWSAVTDAGKVHLVDKPEDVEGLAGKVTLPLALWQRIVVDLRRLQDIPLLPENSQQIERLLQRRENPAPPTTVTPLQDALLAPRNRS